MSPRPKRLPPVTRGDPPRHAMGAHEVPRRAPLRDLQALAADLGLGANVAMSWHGRRLNLGQAKADAGARIGLHGRSLRH